MPVLVLYLIFHYEEDDEIYNYHGNVQHQYFLGAAQTHFKS